MFRKEDIRVVRKIVTSDFYENYIVYYIGLQNKTIRKYFDLRVSRKSDIVIRQEQKLILEEWKVRNKVRCNFLINVVTTFQDNKFLYYFTELPQGGYLYFYLRQFKTFPLEIARFLFSEMLLGIQYLHAKKLIYRSLYPENIMITIDGHIKLKFDFLNCLGLTKDNFERLIEYIPVDYLLNGESMCVSDYWSLGIVLYEMLYGVTPFKGITMEETKNNILTMKVIFSNKIDKQSNDLLSRLLIKTKNQRLGYRPEDRYQIRAHPFFKDIEWINIANCSLRSPLAVVQDSLFEINSETKLVDIYQNDYKHETSDGYGNMFKYYGGFKFNKNCLKPRKQNE